MHAITGEASGELVLRICLSTLPDGDRRAEVSLFFSRLYSVCPE